MKFSSLNGVDINFQPEWGFIIGCYGNLKFYSSVIKYGEIVYITYYNTIIGKEGEYIKYDKGNT